MFMTHFKKYEFVHEENSGQRNHLTWCTIRKCLLLHAALWIVI